MFKVRQPVCEKVRITTQIYLMLSSASFSLCHLAYFNKVKTISLFCFLLVLWFQANGLEEI